MPQYDSYDNRPRGRGRGLARTVARGCVVTALVWAAALAWAEPVRAIAVEPLMLRVQDAEGAPGERTAIVVRTYASRPVRRGRIATGITAFARPSGAPVALLGTTMPIQSCDSVQLFGLAGEVTSPACTFDVPTQAFDINFESLTSSINALDGVLGVIYVTLAPDAVPGDQYTIALDLGVSYLDDPEDDPVLLETRAGTLTIRAPTAPVSFSVDGGKVEPGSGAVIEIGTAEPYELQEGRLLISYDPAVAAELPQVITDPRHGDVSVTVTYPQAGRVQIDFHSALETFNRVPGDLLVMHFGTPPTVPVGTLSPLTILTGANQSSLIAPGSMPLQVAWEAQPIEFELDPGIFNDGFDIGDSGFWSHIP